LHLGEILSTFVFKSILLSVKILNKLIVLLYLEVEMQVINRNKQALREGKYM